MHSPSRSSRTRPQLRPALIGLRTKSMALLGSAESYSEDTAQKTSSMQDLSLRTRNASTPRNLRDKFTFPSIKRDTPTKSFPSSQSISLQERDPELHPIMPRNTSTPQSYSQKQAQPLESHAENPIDPSFHQRVIDFDELGTEIDRNSSPHFINPFSGQNSLNGSISSRSHSSLTHKTLPNTFTGSFTRRQTLNSITSVPKTIASKFSTNLLRRQDSTERDLVGGSVGGKAMVPVANFSSQERNGDTLESLDVLKCATPSLRSATNTQSSAASSPEFGSVRSLPGNHSDRNGLSTRTNARDPHQSPRVRYQQTFREIEPDLDSLPNFQRRVTFSNAARGPKTLVKKFSRTFSIPSRPDLTESFLESDRENECAKTTTVRSVAQEFRHIDFTSKTGLSAQPTDRPDRTHSPSLLTRISTIAKPSLIRSPQYHKPTMFSQRYDSLSSPAEVERAASSSGGGHAEFNDLVFAYSPQEISPFPPTPLNSTSSQSYPITDSSYTPVLDSPSSVDRKIQFPYKPLEKPVDFSIKFRPTLISQAGLSHIRPRTAPLITPPPIFTHMPASPGPETPTPRSRTANRGPGIEMLATLSALEELCNGSPAFFGDDESVFETEGTIDPLQGDL